MFYQSDYKINQFLPRYKRRSLRELKKKMKFKLKKPGAIEDKETKIDDDILLKYILSFCENTSIHGVKYVGQELHWIERCRKLIQIS